MANILVTGGTGLIGSPITERLAQAGHSIASYDLVPNLDNVDPAAGDIRFVTGDICDRDALDTAVKAHAADHIVHLAAIVSDAADEDPHRTMAANVGGVSNVLKVARVNNVRRVVWTSSAAALGTNGGYDGRPVDEIYDVRPATLYGCSKLAAEFVSGKARAEGMDCIAIRPALVFGLGRLTGGAGAFNSAVRDVASGRPAVLHTLDGLSLQMMYNRDFARLIESMLFSPKRDLLPVYNMPSHGAVSAQDLAEVLRRLVPGADITIQSSPAWQPVPPLMDGGRAERDFEFSIQYDIEAAFSEMIDRFRSCE